MDGDWPTFAGMWYPSTSMSSVIILGNTGTAGYNLHTVEYD